MSQPLASSSGSRADPSKACFVVMPFGEKPMRDGTERLYDFDKVYRVLLQRAIRDAGLRPIRADEKLTSAIIHTDMFKDLRDQPVVLADLSLGNPNVFYELGIRHVMSSRGTVLICCKGMDLPFDVNLSRVVFYNYDGQNLDWEEVERVVPQLQAVLQQAQNGDPDSPVHALLEAVLREPRLASPREGGFNNSGGSSKSLEPYQKLVANTWRMHGEDFDRLLAEHGKTVFGARSLAYYCLDGERLPGQAARLAKFLIDDEQYDLANRIFEKLMKEGRLEEHCLLTYASSYSEEHPNLSGADEAIGYVHKFLRKLDESGGAKKKGSTIRDRAKCLRSLAGLLQWKWQLTREGADFEAALDAWQKSLVAMEKARSLGDFSHPGRIAQAHLKVMLLLRVRDGNVHRPDREGHAEAVLELKSQPGDEPIGLSYLSWYQAITLADLGSSEASQQASISLAQDAKIMGNPEHWEIGRRQYSRLRRFIEEYAEEFRRPDLVGRVSQLLQTGQQRWRLQD